MWRVVILALIIVSTAGDRAEAAWLEYRNAELGFGVLFPQQPNVTQVTYKLPLVPNPPMARTFSASENNSHFTATVVDFQGREDEGASLLIEAEFYLALIGDIVLSSTSRVQG